MRIGLIEVVPSREDSSPETQGQIGKTAAKRKMKKGDLFEARMPVPKFVCRVSCASGFTPSMDSDGRRDTMSIAQKAQINSITLKKRNLGTR